MSLFPTYRPDPKLDLVLERIVDVAPELVVPNGCKKHEAMGFHNGWGTALDQLVALVKAG